MTNAPLKSDVGYLKLLLHFTRLASSHTQFYRYVPWLHSPEKSASQGVALLHLTTSKCKIKFKLIKGGPQWQI